MGPDCLTAATQQPPAAMVRVTVTAVLPARALLPAVPLPLAPVLLLHGFAGQLAPGVQALACASNAGGQGSVPPAPANVTSQALVCRPALKPRHVHMPACFSCNPISALARLLGG